MAILSSEDFSARLQELIGDRTDDTALNFIRDATDTINNSNTDNENWKHKYEENDAEWRQRYKDAFFSSPDPAFNTEDTGAEKPLTYESLFKGDK